MNGDAHPLTPKGSTLAVLDACVLLPPRLSDVLMDLALQGLYAPLWTQDIEAEFLRNWSRVVIGSRRRADVVPLDPQGAAKRLAAFRRAIPFHEIVGHDVQSVLERVPPQVHADDVHVVAAALVARDACRAEKGADAVFIISDNVRDLAQRQVRGLGIYVVSPGVFVDKLYRRAPRRVIAALLGSILDLRSPPLTRAELAEILRRHGAVEAPAALELEGDGVPLVLREPALQRSVSSGAG